MRGMKRLLELAKRNSNNDNNGYSSSSPNNDSICGLTQVPIQELIHGHDGHQIWRTRQIWMCSYCQNQLAQTGGSHHHNSVPGTHLQQGHQLTPRQYALLSQQRKRFDHVLISNNDGVELFTYTLKNSYWTEKIHLEINKTYFSRPLGVHAVRSDMDLFTDLTKAMMKQLELKDVAISITLPPSNSSSQQQHPPPSYLVSSYLTPPSSSGSTFRSRGHSPARASSPAPSSSSSSTVDIFRDINVNFRAAKLERLRLTRLPDILQKPDLKIECRSLRVLCLDGIQTATEPAAKNLIKLLERNEALSVLSLNRMRFSPIAIETLNKGHRTRSMLSKRFSKLECLSLAGNDDLSYHELSSIFIDRAMGIVSSASSWSSVWSASTTSSSSSSAPSLKLIRLDLSGNPQMGYYGWSQFLEQFRVSRRNTMTEMKFFGSEATEQQAMELTLFLKEP
ncbi:hypothetical protein BGZ83_003601 [Gryganskiella cystojenkinii]|nr:hypothetical protein BGZ83_003601 [Gryganskiella cystojenkinii]